MADPVASSAGSAAKGSKNFLFSKVGPLPMWAWLAAGVALYLYFRHQQAASSSASQAPNQQTDPAGNVGSIDPATGYVYGTPEDTAALAANNSGSTGTGNAGQSATTGGQSYADNNAWGIAAVNYLVGLGIDATTANQAVQNYLSSQPLTTAQQGDVNLAIQALGPPPTLPGPVSSNPPPVTTPGGGTGGTGTGGTVSVPDVKGKSVAEADAAIKKAGLIPGSHSTDTGTVNGQTPGAGTKVATGSKVDLSVAASGHLIGGGNPPQAGGKTAPVPTGLVVSAKHSTSATVKWNRSSGASGYQVSVTDAGTKRVVQNHGTKSLTDTIGGLTPSHTYEVHVAAEPNSGANAAFASVSFTTPRTG